LGKTKVRVLGYLGIVLIALLVVFAVAFVYLNKSQVAETGGLHVEWQQFLPGISGSRLIQTSDGGFLVLGTNATFQEGANSWDTDIFVNKQSILVKTDSSGNMVWQRAFVVEGLQPNLFDVIETNDGGFLTIGGIISIDSGGFQTLGSKYCVIKLNNNGDELWSQTYAEQLPKISEGVQSVFETNEGNYVLLGRYRYDWDYHFFWHNWFVKIDSTGRLLVNGSIPVGAMSVSPITDKEYIVFSEWQATGGGSKFGLAKIDSNGNLIWGQTYNQTGANSAYENCGIKTNDSGFLLGGELNNYGWLIKTNSEGVAQWNKTYSGLIYSMTQTSDGKYVICGYTVNDVGRNDSGQPTAWIAKLDNKGEIEAQLETGESTLKYYYATAKQIIQDSNGGYVFVGTFDETDQASTRQKFWLVKISD
jgi:hypothetical protein